MQLQRPSGRFTIMKNLITASLLLITHTVAFADVTLSEAGKATLCGAFQ